MGKTSQPDFDSIKLKANLTGIFSFRLYRNKDNIIEVGATCGS